MNVDTYNVGRVWFKGIEVDLITCLMTDNGYIRGLTTGSASLLAVLLASRGGLVRHLDLIIRIGLSADGLQTAIGRLRRSIRGSRVRIVNVRNRGFRVDVADVADG